MTTINLSDMRLPGGTSDHLLDIVTEDTISLLDMIAKLAEDADDFEDPEEFRLVQQDDERAIRQYIDLGYTHCNLRD